jgi:hypothetical protein
LTGARRTLYGRGVKTTKLRESIDGESSEQWEANFATRAGDEAAGENTLGEAESANSASE